MNESMMLKGKKKNYVHEMCLYAYIYIVAQVAESRQEDGNRSFMQ